MTRIRINKKHCILTQQWLREVGAPGKISLEYISGEVESYDEHNKEQIPGERSHFSGDQLSSNQDG
jgi:hypothetical protein